MTKYSDIEIETAKNLLKEGYKWIAREKNCKIWAYKNKPHRDKDQLYCAWNYNDVLDYFQICTKHVPIFLNVTCDDKEPISLESIVHPQILDDVEKRYLSAVIRPFRDRVWYIMKSFAVDKANCYIFIRFNDGSSDMDFPVFRKGDMYKDMKMGKAYSLEELGI